MELNLLKCRKIFGCGTLLLFVLLLLLPVANVYAQGKIKVSGTVVDESGPLIGAHVLVKNTVNGVSTDVDGKFELMIESPATILVFSFMGYVSQEIIVGDRTTINVKLEPESEIMEEVVVVGYGVQKKESVVGSISTIEVSNLKIPGSQLSTSLAGQLSGIVSMSRSGEPGKSSAADFYIRGVSSFQGSSNPLVLVDGVERDLDLVDTDDIASFSVLKDASASAVYGVRGANGVILITTKKGSTGRPEIKLRAEAGITQPTKLPKFVNSWQFAKMFNEAYGSNYYSDEDLAAYANHTDPDLRPDVDWMKALYRNIADKERVSLSISGGGDVARYYISGGFYNEASIYRDAGDTYDYNSSINYNKFNFRANIDLNLTKTTVMNLNLANIYEKSFSPGTDQNIWSWAFSTSPNAFPTEYSNGYLSGPNGSGQNPWNLLVHTGYREQFWNSAQSLIGVKQDLGMVTQGLSANIKFSWDAWNTQVQRRSKNPTWYTALDSRDEEGNLQFGDPSNRGDNSLSFASSTSSTVTTYLEGSINYNRLLAEQHRVGAMFLYNHKVLRWTSGQGADNSLPYKNQGIAARLTYAFRDKYMLEFNMGYNGSENFASGHRFGFFPAVSGGWMLSEESFWRPIKEYVNTFKIRASYGKVGNDQLGNNNRWLYLSTVIDGNSFTMGETGGNGGGGIAMGRPENLKFSWEEEKKLDVGIELMLFNQLRIQADYFHNRREGILMLRNGLPGISGIASNSGKQPYTNLGKTDNEGVDMSLEWNKQFGNWYFTARGNFTFNRNKLVDIDQPDWEYRYQNQTGKPYGAGGSGDQPWGLVALGLFKSQEEIDNSPVQNFGEYRVGDIKYLDVNGDGVVDAQDKIYLGYTTMPEITYGFGVTAAWKGIDLNLFFQGVGHVNFFVNGGSITTPFSDNESTRRAVQLDVWKKGWRSDRSDAENAAAAYPRLSVGTGGGYENNRQTSSWWQRNGSFMRLKNAEIGYSFPKAWMVRSGFIQSLRVYVSGNNLCTFSKFKLWYPELGGGQGDVYPPNRYISVGLNVNF